MCLFCERDVKKNRNHECFIFYNCDKCGKYIVPMSQINRIKKWNRKTGLNDYREKLNDKNSVLFIGNMEKL